MHVVVCMNTFLCASLCFQAPCLTTLTCLTCAGAIEHAAWTKGSRHMQPLRDDLNWFQTKSLDVILFLALVCVTLLAVVIVTLLAVVIVTLLFVCKWLMQLIQQKRQIPHAKTG